MSRFFHTTDLSGNRVLVEGTDIRGNAGSQVIDANEWLEIKGALKYNEAHEQFDDTVRSFFAPLMEAVDALQADRQPQLDPLSYVVVQEGVDSVQGQDEIAVRLSPDSMILRLLESDPQTGRLIWVNDVLEILPEQTAPAAVKYVTTEAGSLPDGQPF